MRILLLLSIFMIMHSALAMDGIRIGFKAPEIKAQDTQGKIFVLSEQKLTTILVFFRGSWCPYCIKQLQSINEEVVKKLDNDKTQIVAISVDRSIVAKKMKDHFKLDFIILSDPKAVSLKSYNIVNKITDELVAKYKSSYKIDVEGNSGEKHHMIAHPAVFIIKKGKVIFSDVHKDYKRRTENAEILKVLK